MVKFAPRIARVEDAGRHPGVLAAKFAGLIADSGATSATAIAAPVSTPELLADIERARDFPRGFLAWAKHWHFRNRETGAELTFAEPWPGQLQFAQLMIDVAIEARALGDWLGIFALKAGKLGFTELECCWDGYVAWALRNGRIHLFSKEEDAAKEMLGYVKFGLSRLSPSWGVRFLASTAQEVDAARAGNKQFRFTVLRGDDRDYGDTRQVLAYATGKFPAISDSCQHAHVDEWAHMENPRGAWSSIATTIAPGCTCHIVTRGAGENKDVEDSWAAAGAGESKLRAYFAPWYARPDRDDAWLKAQAGTHPTLASLAHFAAENPEDAFRGDEDNDFVAVEVWDHCAELIACAAGHTREAGDWQPTTCEHCRDCEADSSNFKSYLATHPLLPGDRTPIVVSVDAATSHDSFGITGISRHPLRPNDPAIRVARIWTPDDFDDGRIDYPTVESWLRAVAEGGCILGHPQYSPWKGGGQCKPRKGQTWAPGQCPACAAGNVTAPFNVVQIVYDPYQLEEMMQGLRRDGVAWCEEMSQGKDRLEADRTTYDVIVGRRLGHAGDPRLREHVQNAKGKTQKDEDSKIRIVKKAAHRKIDLLVSASMGIARCLYLNL